MPFVTVDYFAGAGPEVRRTLQERMVNAVVDSFGAPPSSVRVFTRTFDPADTFAGDGRTELNLPVIRVEFLPGRTREQKNALLKAIGHAASETIGIPLGQVRTILFEKEKADWGRGALSVHSMG